MQLSLIVEGISEDLRRAGQLGGEETARVAELLVGSVESSVGLRILDALQEAARELTAGLAGAEIEVRMNGRDPYLHLSLAEQEEPAEPASGESGVPGYIGDELARLTVRLPEGLKNQVERAAQIAGASINSWIVSSVARAVDGPITTQPGRRIPRRMTGYVQG